MTTSICRGKFRVTLYDKRKDYKFNVISYPFLDGNIPHNQSYSVFISQLVHFAKINTTVEGFYSNVSDLAMKLVSQGFSLAALRKKFVKFYQSKLNVWCKFGVDIYKRLIKLFLYVSTRFVFPRNYYIVYFVHCSLINLESAVYLALYRVLVG